MSETLENNNTEKKNELTLKSVVVDCATGAATHPITYVKTLIQLGHEPLPTYQGRKWTYVHKATYLPGALTYAKHIVTQDGVFGLFRGLTPRLGSSLTFNLASRYFDEQLAKHAKICPEEASVEGSWEDGLKKTAKKIAHKSLAESAAIIVSYPLNVLAIRSMAQFISREDAYESLIGGILEIKDEEGWKGFFAGLIPKLVGVVLGIALIETTSFCLRKQINSVDDEVKSENKDLFNLLDQHASLFAGVIANGFTYPFALTSTIMAVNGSRLHCAKGGHTEWMKCLSELKELKAHQRGSTIFFGRKYKEVAVKVAAFAFCLAESVNGVSKKCVINC